MLNAMIAIHSRRNAAIRSEASAGELEVIAGSGLSLPAARTEEGFDPLSGQPMEAGERFD